MTKKLLIGAGILAGAGLAYYFWKKNQPVTEEKSKATGRSKATSRLGNALVSTGKMKVGDKWIDTSSRPVQCCEAIGSDTWKCTPAPCTIKA